MTRRLDAGGVSTVDLRRRLAGRGAAIVEYAGGEIVASHVLLLRSGGAAGACTRAGPGELAVPMTRTLRAESRIALLNTGTTPADVSVELIADGRRIRPERLKRRLVPPRSVRVYRLGDYAFDVTSLTAVVLARSGRVVAEALVQSADGVSLHGGAAPVRTLVATAGASGPPSETAVVATGEEDSGIAARLLGQDRQGRARGIPDALAPEQTARAPIPTVERGAPVAYAYDVSIGSPVTAGATWRRRLARGTDRSFAEAAAPAFRWGAVAAGTSTDGSARALVVNPGELPARVRIRMLGVAGERSSELVVGAGRLAVIPFGAGGGTFGLVAESDRAVVVTVDSVNRGVGTFALGYPASPLTDPPPVAVANDFRVGVPAPLPST